MSKFCFSCGSSIDTAATFCPACGKPQTDSVPRKKEPGIAAILTFIIPGAGQIYAERIGRGIVIFIGCFVLAGIALSGPALLGMLYLLVWIWAIYDAHQSAARTVRVPFFLDPWAVPSLLWTIGAIGLIFLAMMTVVLTFGRIIPGGPLDRLIH